MRPIEEFEDRRELITNPKYVLDDLGRIVNPNVILTRVVRRLNQLRRSGKIYDYEIHFIDNRYFFEMIHKLK